MLILICGIAAINLFAALLILLRPKLFRTKLYKPMLKNMGLSLLPLLMLVITAFLTGVIVLYLNPILGMIVGILGMLLWVLLLPNAGYLITELNFSHRTVDKKEVPIWYDIIAVLSLSMSGVMNTLLNVMLIQLTYAVIVHPINAFDLGFDGSRNFWIIISILFLLISFGVYIGRYLRFNSWDIVKPKRFWNILKTHLEEKGKVRELFIFMICYTVFFLIMYWIVIWPILTST